MNAVWRIRVAGYRKTALAHQVMQGDDQSFQSVRLPRLNDTVFSGSLVGGGPTTFYPCHEILRSQSAFFRPASKERTCWDLSDVVSWALPRC